VVAPFVTILVPILFFFSGACALIYQVLWLRMLGLVFGVTVYAASTVWAAFMAGLALGSVGGGRLAGKLRRPLFWFGVAEVLVGVSAAATPLALQMLQRWYVSMHPLLPQSSAVMTLARFVMAALMLLPPTILMGTTLPLVVRSALGRGELGSRVGLLYGFNTAGAIAGTIVAGLWLIPGVGIQASFRYAAAVNLAIGAAAMAAGWKTGWVPSSPLVDDGAARPVFAQRVVLWAFAVSGFASLALEVIWFRVLVLFVRPTVYTFSLMLATVLAGIALGSWLIAPFLRRGANWLTVLALVELALALSVVLSFAALPFTQEMSAAWFPTMSKWMPDYLPAIIVTSVMVMFPSALLMGVAFPIGVKIFAGDSTEHQTARLGVFYALNVCGAIGGSLAAGFLLLPMAGSRASLLGVGATILLSGFAIVAVTPLSRNIKIAVAAMAALSFAVAAFTLVDPMRAFIAQRFPGESIIWIEEGVQSTVSVNQFGRFRMETMDGIHQASDTSGLSFIHHRLGQLPMAIHPNPREALVVGLGGGATAGAVGMHTGVNVHVVELSPAVVHAASYFEKINYGVLRRPNVTVRVDDGRNYLLLTRWKYDVITADIILPIHAGSTNVYSREYFQAQRNALNDAGLVAQWIDGTEAEYKLIMRTFLSVFPNATLWAEGSVLIGSVRPLRVSRADFEWKMAVPERAQGFRDINMTKFVDLTNLYTAGPKELASYVGEGPLLTDDRPLAEYFLSLPRDRPPDKAGFKRDLSEIVVP
jgi:spermidine synthase